MLSEILTGAAIGLVAGLVILTTLAIQPVALVLGRIFDCITAAIERLASRMRP